MRKFRGNQFANREEPSISLDDLSNTFPPKSKRVQYTLPRHGYTCRHSALFSYRKKSKFNASNDTVSMNEVAM